MKKLNIQRAKAKIRQYRIKKNKVKSEMLQGDVDSYIKGLISFYKVKNQMKHSLVAIPVK